MTLPGQAESGDRHLVAKLPGGVLVGVVDGLGHGEEAAVASEVAVRTLQRYAREPLLALLRRCHEELMGTRGVVMSLATIGIPKGMVSWLGIGNVEGLLLRAGAARRGADASLLLRRGVVGVRLPAVAVSVAPLAPGDTLIFATDGIRTAFAQEIGRLDPPQAIADDILARHGKGTDDALVLVARYVGGEP
ncbi:MAG: stage II sporulation protein E (SpoIIE) [Acidobacteria bacterium]|nr:MAG: stage II sporulation protein E (SpoIIE) [Acidobacteriota bacterium]